MLSTSNVKETEILNQESGVKLLFNFKLYDCLCVGEMGSNLQSGLTKF